MSMWLLKGGEEGVTTDQHHKGAQSLYSTGVNGWFANRS